jgi:hypothetical protein
LIVAIPTLVAYHMIMARIDAAAAALDNAANLWLSADDEPAVPAVPQAVPVNTNGELVAAGV